MPHAARIGGQRRIEPEPLHPFAGAPQQVGARVEFPQHVTRQFGHDPQPLFRGFQPLFLAPQLGQIPDRPDDTHRFFVIVMDHEFRMRDPDAAPRPGKAEFPFEPFAALLERLEQLAMRSLALGLEDELRDIVQIHFGRRLRSENPFEILVGPERAGDEVPVEDHALRGARCQFEPLAVALGCELLFARMGDIGHAGYDDRDFASVVADRKGAAGQPPHIFQPVLCKSDDQAALEFARRRHLPRRVILLRQRRPVLEHERKLLEFAQCGIFIVRKTQQAASLQVDHLHIPFGRVDHDTRLDLLEDQAKLLLELFIAKLAGLALGNVTRDPDITDQFTIVAELRRDRHAVPERIAILAIVEDVAIELRTRIERLADPPLGLGRSLGPLQEPARPPEHLALVIAGNLAEIAIGVSDLLCGIGEHHPVPDRLENFSAKHLVQLPNLHDAKNCVAQPSAPTPALGARQRALSAALQKRAITPGGGPPHAAPGRPAIRAVRGSPA